MQYSGAQKVPGKIEMPNLPPSAIDENGEPEVQGEEPEVQGEDEGPTDKGGQPEVQGEDDLTTKDDETESEEQPEPTDPRKGVEGGLDIANTTQQTLPPAYKVKVSLESIAASYISDGKNCAWWVMVAYVQGKLVKIYSHPGGWSGAPPESIGVCKDNKYYELGYPSGPPSVNVEIPNDLVESIKDYQPLSIFTVGWQNDSPSTCPLRMNAPEELPEVQRILADYKGSAHADAKEKIARIQHEVQNQISVGCSPTPPTETSHPKNQRLDTVNVLLTAPSYGIKVAAEDALEKRPYWHLITNCETSPYCIVYGIHCDLCAVARQH